MTQVLEQPKLIRHDAAHPFWLQEEPKMSPDGKDIMRGGMWKPQRDLWNLPNFIKIFVSGYGGGKTHIMGKRMIASALNNAPVPVGLVSPSYPLARKTTIPTIEMLLSGKQSIYGRKHFDWSFNKSSHEFHIYYHGRHGLIYVMSGDDPLSLRGPNLGAAGIDEPFIQDVAVFNQMNARVRDPRAKFKEILLTGTAEYLNWGYDLACGELKDKHDVGLVQSSTRANKAVGDDYVARLMGTFADREAETYVEGKFVNAGVGMIFYAFDPMVNGDKGNVQQLEIPRTYELGCGMDFNVNPMSAVVFWKSGDHMHVIDEIELANADTEYMCSYLKVKYGEKLTTIYPDATGNARKTSAPGGKTDFTYIRDAGFEIYAPHASPKIRDTENSVNAKFKNRNGRVTLTIEPKCKKLIKYLSVASHELRLKQEPMSHLLSALRYCVHYLCPATKEQIGEFKLSGY